MDLIGKLRPSSLEQHYYIVVATDYFTKWVEAVPAKSVTSDSLVQFIEQHIIHRFGIPESITADRGSVFICHQVEVMAQQYDFQILNSTPYYAQGNGQAESLNKSIKASIEKMVDKNPREWHILLSEALWALRTSKRSSTGVTPYSLVYGYDIVLPMEMTVWSLRVARQMDLDLEEYTQAMCIELQGLDETILPLGKKDPELGKWSPTWDGPYIVDQVQSRGVYRLKDSYGKLCLRIGHFFCSFFFDSC
ncbi:uncharacterized protein LOC132272767 [Cornus florida]|uniref:uncharacterized protein LOC132272767 n=1 Tax=Cornus florida TaxID=4283 RepID=UPI0028A171DF|nr:uncharacterized protein LOC132272767 [Cornus florida]